MFVRRLASNESFRPCKSTSGCPDLWEMADGDFAVIGTDITTLANLLPPDAGCAPHERMVKIPRELLVRAKAAIPGGH
jgi:hypothetical protein